MRARLLSGRAVWLHLAVLVVVPGCLFAGWWMFSRARHGDAVAWIYTVEWPFFAGYAVYMWWKLLHDDPGARAAAMAAPPAVVRRPLTGAEGSLGSSEAPVFDPYDESDPELAAYNRYLASLHERDRRRA